MERPQSNEYDPFYQGYVEKVDSSDVVTFLKDQLANYNQMLSGLSDEQVNYSYAEGKWSIKQLLRHIIDAEVVFAYRIHAIARGVTIALPGMDQDDYMSNVDIDAVSMADLIDEFNHVRAFSLATIVNLKEKDLARVGTASGVPVTLRAKAFILAGHAEHHKSILEERYLPHV